MISAKLDAAIKAVCPIHGISIGRKDDKSTWRIDFKDEASAQERAAAQAVLNAFDLAADAAADAVAAQRAAVQKKLAEIDAKSIRALREWVATQPTAPQFLKDREAEAASERAKLR